MFTPLTSQLKPPLIIFLDQLSSLLLNQETPLSIKSTESARVSMLRNIPFPLIKMKFSTKSKRSKTTSQILSNFTLWLKRTLEKISKEPLKAQSLDAPEFRPLEFSLKRRH